MPFLFGLGVNGDYTMMWVAPKRSATEFNAERMQLFFRLMFGSKEEMPTIFLRLIHHIVTVFLERYTPTIRY